MREKKQVKQFERLFRPVEWNTTCGERGDGNYEWWWSEGFYFIPWRKWVVWGMTGTHQDWPACQNAFNWTERRTKPTRSADSEGILFRALLVIETSKSRKDFLKGLLVLFLINPTWKARLSHSFTYQLLLLDPIQAPNPPITSTVSSL